ncbi:helix-turn-helix transcriptional regulator [Blastochloris viridis]|uniref:ATP-dependent transcriptional regulator n=1 Tax=Blastochloris viridis TaxID=1079 RepID=A0A0H5BGY3_BLAVI|nr:LuxR C-terminal-related transcriptional regulator [Blastochloris viridis]ALK09721.1 hypothetical protein BVIR_1951 [Blastochloris viridis]BAS00385.1 transcriptional regulatory protein [Blastochloris viridis]CUU42384.1 ATP-dependent transcriptional regulator [Blastochloris viridis]
MNRRTDIAAALARLAEAPFADGQWHDALRLLAAATGGTFAHLVGWTNPARLPANLSWNEPDRMIERWVELGGANPDINPLVRVGVRTPELRVVTDDEVVSADARRTLPIWQEFYEPYDMPHVCFTPVWRDRHVPMSHLTLAVTRSARAGPVGAEDRAAFLAIARGWREAVLLSQMIGRENGRVLAGAFDALAIAAVALDGFGCVIAVSPAAEAVLRDGGVIGTRQRRLHGATVHAERALETLLAPFQTMTPPPPPVAAELQGVGRALRLRVTALPRNRFSAGFAAATLVVFEGGPAPSAVRPLLPALTPAELDIATALLRGERPAQIAAQRGVSISTVRSQLKAIFAKAEVGGQIEFVARVQRQATGSAKRTKDDVDT